MNHQEFFQGLHARFSDEDLERIARAYWLSKTVHRGQARNNGERYFEHCRRVACRVLEWDGADANAAIVALLHDCEEEGFIPQEVISDLFDEEIAGSVATLSKVAIMYDGITGEIREKIRISDDEYFKRIQDASAQIRRIKISDRLDNLSTMSVWEEERKRRYVVETETYILPIARLTDAKLAEELARALFD